ncbi:aminotransferase class V-fold PLP-dependent enzyme [Lutibacter flavus]|uniref:dTDP-4-amino-4,6-dideoxygalactose transaminase n=1 Tax=Lutibacter flavus TaxID=691689 RepID=A0A238YZF6_9FLAO|nr:aminotransferase class V-fold PLP-dependent enzyme [Lutibacter flavus]SNR75939.1 dTDP-4-amino-4,6-dideoxygalactose transaminase [Lutibacter flavus]
MISKKAEIIENLSRDIHFTNSAREGWEIILRNLNPNSKILLPSYIGITEREGSGIFDPVVKIGVDYDFYLLNDDLSLSISEIKRQLEKQEYDLILLVHYFGFKLKNVNSIINLCKQYNVITVEDCAHLYNYNLYDFSKVGLNSDFIFYSLHKNFPLNDGGAFIQNNLNLKRPNVSTIKLKSNISFKISKYDSIAIAKKRIENFIYLENLLVGIPCLRSLKKIGSEDIPNSYPIIVENGLREKLYFWLLDNNMTVIALYYRLISPLNKKEFKSMKAISDSILNLPVHQDITKSDLFNLTEKIKEFYEK